MTTHEKEIRAALEAGPTRYSNSPNANGLGFSNGVVEDSQGYYVRFAEYASLLSDLTSLREERDRLRGQRDELREALKPFAECASEWDGESDSLHVSFEWKITDDMVEAALHGAEFVSNPANREWMRAALTAALAAAVQEGEAKPVAWIEPDVLIRLRAGTSGLFPMAVSCAPGHRPDCTVPVYAHPAPADAGTTPQLWQVEQYKIWKGINPDRPLWSSLNFVSESWDDMMGICDYLRGNNQEIIVRVVKADWSETPTEYAKGGE